MEEDTLYFQSMSSMEHFTVQRTAEQIVVYIARSWLWRKKSEELEHSRRHPVFSVYEFYGTLHGTVYGRLDCCVYCTKLVTEEEDTGWLRSALGSFLSLFQFALNVAGWTSQIQNMLWFPTIEYSFKSGSGSSFEFDLTKELGMSPSQTNFVLAECVIKRANQLSTKYPNYKIIFILDILRYCFLINNEILWSSDILWLIRFKYLLSQMHILKH